MKVRDLLEAQKDNVWGTNTICKSRVIALDAKDGKILFDTYKNKAAVSTITSRLLYEVEKLEAEVSGNGSDS